MLLVGRALVSRARCVALPLKLLRRILRQLGAQAVYHERCLSMVSPERRDAAGTWMPLLCTGVRLLLLRSYRERTKEYSERKKQKKRAVSVLPCSRFKTGAVVVLRCTPGTHASADDSVATFGVNEPSQSSESYPESALLPMNTYLKHLPTLWSTTPNEKCTRF